MYNTSCVKNQVNRSDSFLVKRPDRPIPAYILATMPVYDPAELLRANRVATVQRSLRRLSHVHCHDMIQT